MTASQQPDAERAPLTSPAAGGSGSTGHDKAVTLVRDEVSGIQIGSGYYATTVGIDAAREIAEAAIAALRAALAAGDPNVAEALGLREERQWPQERRLLVEHEGHPYGLDRYWHPCPACNPIEGEFEWIDRRRFVTDWRQA